MNKHVLLRFGLILIIAVIFRCILLSSSPPSLFRDEVEKGYSAYCIARWGGALNIDSNAVEKPIYFAAFPLFINVYGSYTSMIYQYVCASFVGLGGLTSFTTRLPAALISIITVILVFAFLRFIENKRVAFFGMFFFAISPWHIAFSRWAQQGIFVPFFITTSLIFFFWMLKEKRLIYAIISSLCMVLAVYSYAPARIFVPLLSVALLISFRNDISKHKREFGIWLGILCVASIPIYLAALSFQGAERFNRISIFSTGESILRITGTFFLNYIKHFSPVFLFLKGDAELRHSMAGFGQLHLIEAPFFLGGVIYCLLRRKKWHQLLLWWLLIFPVPASLTREGIPHALRSICALPMPHIFTALGISWCFDFFKRTSYMIRGKRIVPFRALLISCTIFLILSMLLFGVSLFYLYPLQSARSWQYGVLEGLDAAREAKVTPESIVYISGNIPYNIYYVLFSEKISPRIVTDERSPEKFPYVFLSPWHTGESYRKAGKGSVFLLTYQEWRDIQLVAEHVETVYIPLGIKRFPEYYIFRK